MADGKLTRRRFLTRSLGTMAAGLAAPYILPRPAFGANDVITRGVVGTGGRGGGFLTQYEPGKPAVTLAVCDVDGQRLARAAKRVGGPVQAYTDFRHITDRTDIDVVYIATPPHWHALVCIHAAQSGKDVYCEKPMTKFIHEGRAVSDAILRYGRVFHIGTGGRYGARGLRRLIDSGVLGKPILVRMPRWKYNWKVRGWSGRTHLVPQPVPAHLDWDMWLGPAPAKPYHPHRCHGSFRGYWDYDGGGYTDMGAHFWDPVHYFIGADNSGPIEIEAKAPWPAHPDAVRVWGSITYKFPNDITVKCTSGEWGDEEPPKDTPFIEGPKGKVFANLRTDPPGLFKEAVRKAPEPPPMIGFNEALRVRKQPGGNAEASHRVSTTMHLGNLAIRLGRSLRWDPQKERILGDEEANRYVNIPMRRPWHL